MSEINPADLSVSGGSSSLSDEFSSETPNVETPTPVRKPEREGLPSGYRMRADSHYVDQLLTPRAGRGREPARCSSRRVSGRDAMTHVAVEAPENVVAREPREHRDLRTDRLLAQLSEDLATVESSVATLTSGASPTARRVTLDVLRAHTWRAAWLVRAQTLSEKPVRAAGRPRPIGGLFGRLRRRRICRRMPSQQPDAPLARAGLERGSRRR